MSNEFEMGAKWALNKMKDVLYNAECGESNSDNTLIRPGGWDGWGYSPYISTDTVDEVIEGIIKEIPKNPQSIDPTAKGDEVVTDLDGLKSAFDEFMAD